MGQSEAGHRDGMARSRLGVVGDSGNSGHAPVPHASARGRPREWASGVRAAAWVTCTNLKRSTPSSAFDDSWRDKQGRAARIDLR
jgi:hypothetical protein